MSRTNNEFRRQMFRKVGRGFWRNAHAPSLPQASGSGTTESRPFPATAAKVMESAGQHNASQRVNSPSGVEPNAGCQGPEDKRPSPCEERDGGRDRTNQSMTTPDPLPEIPEIIRSALGLVTDAVNRGAWRQVMDRCRILSDAAMVEWIKEDRAATEAAAKINPPEIR